MSAVLDIIDSNAEANTLKGKSLNDYPIEVSIADAREWPTIVAVKVDGKYISVRDKGPLWLVDLRRISAQFGNNKFNACWIWQIATIKVQ